MNICCFWSSAAHRPPWIYNVLTLYCLIYLNRRQKYFQYDRNVPRSISVNGFWQRVITALVMTFRPVCAAVVRSFIVAWAGRPEKLRSISAADTQSSAVAAACRKSCSEWHIWAGLENSVDAGRDAALLQPICVHSRVRGEDSTPVLLICKGDADCGWQHCGGWRGGGQIGWEM